MNIKELMHLHMFDGDGEGAAAGTSDEGGTTPESRETVLYGKAPEDNGRVSQNGTDNGNLQTADLDAEFNELIKGKFKNQYGKHVQNAINNRFKNYDDNRQTIDAYQQATAPLYMLYGLEQGDVEGLAQAIEDDEDLYAHAAEEEGLTAKKFKENMKLRIEAEAGRNMRDEYMRQMRQQQMFAQWDREAAELQKTVPNFDLSEELKNEMFCGALDRGYDVQMAFNIAHMQDILSGAMQQSAQESKQQTVDNFKTRAARPPENGAKRQASVTRKIDPSKFTDNDIDEILRRVDKGEKIYL